DAGTNYRQSDASSAADFFLGKYNATSGAMVWCYTGGSPGGGGSDLPYGLGVDNNENIYMMGFVNNGSTAVNFDIKSGTAPSATGIASTTHMYLVKYTTNGDFAWRVNVTNSNNNSGGGLVVDNVNNYVYFGGGIAKNGALNPIFSGTSLTVDASSRDAFIAKYDFDGNRQWVNNIAAGTSSNYVWNMDVDNAGNIYATGVYQGTADFDPSASTRSLTAAGSLDAFVAKYTSAGNHVWSYGIGSASFGEAGYGIKVDGAGSIALGGAMLGQADYNPEGTGGAQLKGVNGQRHIFFGEYDTDFKYQWAHAITSAAVTSWDNYASAVHLDRSQTPSPVYVWGYFRNNSTQDFDPNNAGGDFTATGTADNAFLAKYSTLILLPIKLSSFEVKPIKSGKAELTWVTSTEINNDYFTIQRSSDLKLWEDILVKKGAGNSNQNQHYVDYDFYPLKGVSYYRLKQTDFNGEFSYSEPKLFKLKGLSDVQIYPNPASNELNIYFDEQAGGNVKISITNALGQIVFNESFSGNELNTLKISLNEIPSGFYHVSFATDEELKTQKLIIKK
ncbi:MAG TPA: T9SS type A sorting domain-containing protein, partial [Vicingus sp.]|nr:T9SS type A sorting domain-containing protein [Vicingus sp.]